MQHFSCPIPATPCVRAEFSRSTGQLLSPPAARHRALHGHGHGHGARALHVLCTPARALLCEETTTTSLQSRGRHCFNRIHLIRRRHVGFCKTWNAWCATGRPLIRSGISAGNGTSWQGDIVGDNSRREARAEGKLSLHISKQKTKNHSSCWASKTTSINNQFCAEKQRESKQPSFERESPEDMSNFELTLEVQ